MTIVLPESFDLYFQIVMFFLGGYHIAYLFKNFSRLLEAQGWFVFLFTIAWMFGVISVLLINVEQLQNWWYTLGYVAGFSLRFFRYDY